MCSYGHTHSAYYCCFTSCMCRETCTQGGFPLHVGKVGGWWVWVSTVTALWSFFLFLFLTIEPPVSLSFGQYDFQTSGKMERTLENLASFLPSFFLFFFFFYFQVGLFGSSLWYTSVCGCKRVFRHRGSILQSGQPSHCECLHQELEAVDEPQSSPFRGLCCLAAWFGSRCNPNTTIIAFWLQVFSLL